MSNEAFSIKGFIELLTAFMYISLSKKGFVKVNSKSSETCGKFWKFVDFELDLS